MFKPIVQFYQHQMSRAERLIIWLIGIIVATAFFYIGVNRLLTHYPGNFYVPMTWLIVLPFMLAITVVSIYAKDITPRLAFFTRSYGFYYFILISFGLLATGVQYTPFPTIDHFLVACDNALHFSTPALIDWVAAHHRLRIFLIYMYDALTVEMFLIPLFASLWRNHWPLDRFFISICVAFLVATTIYYFFPTMAPVSMFHDQHFLKEEYYTSTKFYEVHHYLRIRFHDPSLIAFPSMHVVWAILLAAIAYKRAWLFYPLAIVNTLVVLSTLLLGWHYLMDALAGILIAAASLYFAEYLRRQYRLYN